MFREFKQQNFHYDIFLSLANLLSVEIKSLSFYLYYRLLLKRVIYLDV